MFRFVLQKSSFLKFTLTVSRFELETKFVTPNSFNPTIRVIIVGIHNIKEKKKKKWRRHLIYVFCRSRGDFLFELWFFISELTKSWNLHNNGCSILKTLSTYKSFNGQSQVIVRKLCGLRETDRQTVGKLIRLWKDRQILTLKLRKRPI